MDLLLAATTALLFVSFALNLYQLYRYKHRPQQSPKDTQESAALLHDLLSASGAFIQIKIIDKGSFFLRSPNG